MAATIATLLCIFAGAILSCKAISPVTNPYDFHYPEIKDGILKALYHGITFYDEKEALFENYIGPQDKDCILKSGSVLTWDAEFSSLWTDLHGKGIEIDKKTYEEVQKCQGGKICTDKAFETAKADFEKLESTYTLKFDSLKTQTLTKLKMVMDKCAKS